MFPQVRILFPWIWYLVVLVQDTDSTAPGATLLSSLTGVYPPSATLGVLQPLVTRVKYFLTQSFVEKWNVQEESSGMLTDRDVLVLLVVVIPVDT